MAFELMWIVAMQGVGLRMSNEGSTCAGDYAGDFPDFASYEYYDFPIKYYKRSGDLIHASSVILTTIGTLANVFGLYGSFYFYN